MTLGLDFLVTLSAIARWFTFVVSITGFLIALLSVSIAQRILQQSAGGADGERQVLARFGRASEALSVAAQFAFVAVGASFVLSPPTLPTSMAQAAPFFDGILRTAGFGFGALVLALKSALNLVIESSAARPRLMRREAYVAELERANRKLDEAAQAKSAFLANMSHELRTPLNAILGFSTLLQEQLGPSLAERQQRFLRNISEAGDHLLELINDVLDLSKVEAGKVELRPELITLGTLLEPVVAATRTAAQAKGVRLEIDAADANGLFVDATRVRQVLFNLLSNAVKFTPGGGGVRLQASLEGSGLLFEVTDTGIGIPPDAQPRVFGVFERLHEGRESVPGTGLGLAIVKRLVELHGGTITFDSVEGRGTTFRVRLPDVRTAPVAGERILVVEDERRDAALIVAVAALFDLRSEVARTLSEAEKALERSAPLGVVLDLRLPDGRGEDLLRTLKKRGSSGSIPVIVVTVEAEPGEALALGADDYLTKPIDRARLERWLRKVARPVVAPAVVERIDGGEPAHPAR